MDPRATDFFADWGRAASDAVALLRAEAARSPLDRELADSVGELTTQSSKFSALWAAHNVRWHTTGIKHFHHPVAGDIALSYEGMELPNDTGQTFVAFTAEPGSASHQALAFLANWTGTPALEAIPLTAER